jgi:pyruvyl transferase EpsO
MSIKRPYHQVFNVKIYFLGVLVMSDLKANLEALDNEFLIKLKERLIDDMSYFKNRNVIYLDYPVYQNIGDHLIYWGALAALKENGNKVLAQYSIYSFRSQKVRTLIQKYDALIVCQGGGNFGDLYPDHQNFRLKVVKDFPNVDIVVLPQSIHYRSKQNQDSELKCFTKKNVTIHVRDNESKNMLDRYNINVVQSPDLESCDKKTDGFDWEDVISGLDSFVFQKIKKFESIYWTHKISLPLYRWYSKRLISNAIRVFENYDVIDTDRLHGLILGVLMSRFVLDKDNSYGKLSRYKTCWFVK